MDELERLSALYGNRLGMPRDGSQPLPEAAEFDQMPRDPIPNDLNGPMPVPDMGIMPGLLIVDGNAALDGTQVLLTSEDKDAIVKIVAHAIARDAQKQLDIWRDKYALHQKKS